jgi:hypothetical protein
VRNTDKYYVLLLVYVFFYRRLHHSLSLSSLCFSSATLVCCVVAVVSRHLQSCPRVRSPVVVEYRVRQLRPLRTSRALESCAEAGIGFWLRFRSLGKEKAWEFWRFLALVGASSWLSDKGRCNNSGLLVDFDGFVCCSFLPFLSAGFVLVRPPRGLRWLLSALSWCICCLRWSMRGNRKLGMEPRGRWGSVLWPSVVVIFFSP